MQKHSEIYKFTSGNKILKKCIHDPFKITICFSLEFIFLANYLAVVIEYFSLGNYNIR